MNRRKILQYVAYTTGAAVSVPLASSLLVGCRPETATGVASQLHFFDEDQYSMIEKLVDIILPKTDSPSATDIGVHTMIDTMVGTAYRPKARENYKSQMGAFFNLLKEKNFEQEDLGTQIDLLKALDKDQSEGVSDARSGYLHLKQQTITYYLSSEEIGTNYLNYLPVPGQYEPCISLEEAGGKAWAL